LATNAALPSTSPRPIFAAWPGSRARVPRMHQCAARDAGIPPAVDHGEPDYIW
jgi:hypothetical protein